LHSYIVANASIYRPSQDVASQQQPRPRQVASAEVFQLNHLQRLAEASQDAVDQFSDVLTVLNNMPLGDQVDGVQFGVNLVSLRDKCKRLIVYFELLQPIVAEWISVLQAEKAWANTVGAPGQAF
jgi:hypothetical protein